MTKKQINDISYKIVGCAIEVHRNLGPGLLESIYHRCLFEELKTAGLKVLSEVAAPIIYKEKELSVPLKLIFLSKIQ